MNRTPVRIELISDFNPEILCRYLEHGGELPDCTVAIDGFNQVFQSLDRNDGEAFPDVTVVWTRPEGVLPSVAMALAHRPFHLAEADAEVDAFVERLAARAQRGGTLLVATWTLPPGYRGLGPLEHRPGLGAAHLVGRCNVRLAEALAGVGNAFLLDADAWMRAAGPQAGSPRQWFAGKVPFSNRVFQDAARDIKAALAGAAGLSRRLILVDLDDTLWGGVVGETGWQGIRLGGHDAVGEAYAAFQESLKALTRRGLLIGVVSKNDEAVALAAFDHHPEMRLRRSDLAGWRIDWMDKAANVASLAGELNLGLSSVVFIDDNPMERGRVAESLPDVLVPDWPRDPLLFVDALRGLRCFDAVQFSNEDRGRARMYAEERGRRAVRASVGRLEDWLGGLDLRVAIHPLDAAALPRAVQLLNKTNQMNLSTRRLSEVELLAWAQQPGRQVWTVSVGDRFGESGLTGLLGIAWEGPVAHVVDFVLSCRVMGREIEKAMLFVAVQQARAGGAAWLVARHLPTERNAPCLAFWRTSGFAERGVLEFAWDTATDYPLPDHISLTGFSRSETTHA